MTKERDMTEKQFDAYLEKLDHKHEEQKRFTASIDTALYNAERHRFEITLNNGLEFSFNPDLVQEVCTLSPDELAGFRIDFRRTDLQWLEQGAGVNVLSVLQGRYGSRKWMEKLHSEKGIPLGEWPDSPYAKEERARAIGVVKSEKKAAASRVNGKKGGRPRKESVTPPANKKETATGL